MLKDLLLTKNWLVLVLLLSAGCSPSDSKPAKSVIQANNGNRSPAITSSVSYGSSTPSLPDSPALTPPFFVDVAADLGAQFTYVNGAAGNVLMVEATGGGGGWIDYDRDGRLDLYLVQGGNAAADDEERQPTDKLFRQHAHGKFVSVETAATIIERGFSQGAAAADFDDDGFDDIYVTNVGPNSLFQNQGDGTFHDVSQAAQVANPLWSSSAAWGDLNADGNLDLYVCNYVNYDPRNPIPCGSDGRKGTCHPMHVPAVPDECYFSEGDGTFRAEAVARGLCGKDNKGLGVVIADLNNDSFPDVYVANDTTPNFLFINDGHGTFTESAQQLGCAVSREGHPQASMGVALGDYDANGWLDLLCTHFAKESNTLYKNLGEPGFQDVTGIVGLHTPTLTNLGFGTLMDDFNQDGNMDLMVVNGHIDDWQHLGDKYAMEPQLFSFNGTRFVEYSHAAGNAFQKPLIARGLAKGDFDNDGDWDLLIVHQNTPAAILRNDSVRGHWLKLRLNAIGNRRGWGTRVIVTRGGRQHTQELAGGTSYCSTHEPSMIFGLGNRGEPVDLEVRWPDGFRQQLKNVKVDQELLIRQTEQRQLDGNSSAISEGGVPVPSSLAKVDRP